MNFQDLLQGVLSGKWATTAGDDPYGAGKAAIGRDLGNLAGVLGGPQQQPAPQGALAAPQQAPPPPPQQAPLPLGPYAVHPGLQQALQPGQQVAQPGAGDALRDFQNGVLSPQLDPGAPTAAPQPGNGVLAQNNATAVAQAIQGPPMALQSTDESTPTPTEKPGGVLASATPDTAKAPAKSDSVTRAKGILAAATSGDPQAFQSALTDPAAAAQVGSQTPDSAWNERSSYDGQAVSPTTPDGKPKPLSDQHAEDKQKTFGQRFMGALADPDTQDLLQSIGIGLLSNPNAMKGMAEGMQMYQQLHLRRQDRTEKQTEFQAEQKTRDRNADTQALSVQQAGVYQKGELESQKADQDIRRTDAENIARYRAQQLQQSASELGETRRYHDIEAGGQAATRAIERDRMRLEMGQPISTQILPSSDGTGAFRLSTYRDNHTELTKLPDGVAAGLSMVSPSVKADVEAEKAMSATGTSALQDLDDAYRTRQVLDSNPYGVGPDVKSNVQRFVARLYGAEGNDPITELKNLKANRQLDIAHNKLRGQGAVSDRERGLIQDAAENPENMSPALLKQLNDVRIREGEASVGSINAYLDSHPEAAKSPRFSDYTYRRGRMGAQGGARSGADTSGSTPGAVQTTPEEDALITKHLK